MRQQPFGRSRKAAIWMVTYRGCVIVSPDWLNHSVQFAQLIVAACCLLHNNLHACVSCRSETCRPETFFRLAWCAVLQKCAFLKPISDWHRANFVISRADNNVFYTHLIAFEVTLHLLLKNKQTKKQTNKCSLALLWVSFHKFLCFRTLHLTCDFDMTKFAH